MKQNYKNRIPVIETITTKDGGGFEAYYTKSSRLTLRGWGETTEEAIKCLEEVTDHTLKIFEEKEVFFDKNYCEVNTTFTSN